MAARLPTRSCWRCWRSCAPPRAPRPPPASRPSTPPRRSSLPRATALAAAAAVQTGARRPQIQHRGTARACRRWCRRCGTWTAWTRRGRRWTDGSGALGSHCQGPTTRCRAELQRIQMDYCWRDAGLDAFQRALDGSNARIPAGALLMQQACKGCLYAHLQGLVRHQARARTGITISSA